MTFKRLGFGLRPWAFTMQFVRSKLISPIGPMSPIRRSPKPIVTSETRGIPKIEDDDGYANEFPGGKRRARNGATCAETVFVAKIKDMPDSAGIA